MCPEPASQTSSNLFRLRMLRRIAAPPNPTNVIVPGSGIGAVSAARMAPRISPPGNWNVWKLM